jgi:hypothetical protein
MGIEVITDEADQVQFDATRVEGLDPNYMYRWARKDELQIATHELHGYEIVDRTTEKSLLNDRTRMKKGEDLSKNIEWGDMILMRIPKDLYEKRRMKENERILRKTRGVTASYKNAVARITGSTDNAYEEHKDNRAMKTARGADDGPGISAAELKAALESSEESEKD